MNYNLFYKVCKDAIAKYGFKAQLGVLQEECAELIVAASHFRRNRKNSYDELVEELADVYIVWYQIFEYMQCEKEFKCIVDEKIKRLEERIKED